MSRLSEQQWQNILREIELSYSRSGGPGGQKVNKTSSKAELRWSLLNTSALPQKSRELACKNLANLLTTEGEIVIAADSTRSREQNKFAALDRLKGMLDKGLYEPKKRKKTKPRKSAIEKRLNSKQMTQDKKKNRQKVNY